MKKRAPKRDSPRYLSKMFERDQLTSPSFRERQRRRVLQSHALIDIVIRNRPLARFMMREMSAGVTRFSLR